MKTRRIVLENGSVIHIAIDMDPDDPNRLHSIELPFTRATEAQDTPGERCSEPCKRPLTKTRKEKKL